MMDTRMQSVTFSLTRPRIALVVLASLAMAACAAPTRPAPERKAAPQTVAPVDLQVQDAGFTIVEAATVSGEARAGYAEAIASIDRGDRQRGIDMLAAVTTSDPGLATPYIDLGIVYHMAGDLQAAEEQLKKGLALSPGHPAALTELGIVYRKLGRFEDARRSYEEALAVYPGYHFARRNLAILCDLYLGDLKCALQAYEAYMETVPGDDQVTMWIADIRNRMGR